MATGTTGNPDFRKGIALVLISAASFGVMPILIKLSYGGGINTKSLLALRFSLATAAMWLVWAYLYRNGARATINLKTLLPLVALGAVGYVGQSFSYYTAVSIISASATGLLLYTYPILVTVLAWVFFRERLTTRKLLALASATLGTLMVLGLFSSMLGIGTGSAALAALSPVGVAWGLSAAVIYSLYIVAGTRYTSGVHPIFSSAVIITSAAVVYLIWGSLSQELDWAISPTSWLLALAIACISTVLAITLFFAGLTLIGPSRAAIVSTVEPAVTVGLAALVLGERISPEQAAGGALILASVFILQYRASEPEVAHVWENP